MFSIACSRQFASAAGIAVALAAAALGCASDATDPDRPGGKADDTGNSGPTFSVTLAQAGAFAEYGERTATMIHFGYSDEPAPGWEAAGSIDIAFDNSGASEEISIEVPESRRDQFLGFVIFGDDHGIPSATGDQFIDLSSPAGSFVTLPVGNGAGYPFSPECFQIRVRNISSDADTAYYDGKLTHIFYGFTDASVADYQADNDVSWQNISGELKAQGIIYPRLQHDGGYKGTIRMLTEWIRVPTGKNLVYKLALNKFGGSCVNDGDTQFLEFTDTQTYFYEVAAP